MGIGRIKDLKMVKELTNHDGLPRTLTAMDLIFLGIGAVIGTGIFVLTGIASQYSGPSLFLSFLISGAACMFVALAYTEIAAMIPTSGSVYTYSYVGLGEFVAWLSGWLLILEFSVGATTVASGWSGYMVDILQHGGINLPSYLTTVPSKGGIINLPAVLISLLITSILIRGTKTGAVLNNILVVVKLGAIFIFLFIAAPHFDIKHWDDFSPFGFSGIAQAAAVVLLAFTGFDSLATAAEECKNPKRDITIGLIGSLLICTVLYMLVAGMLTGIVPFVELNNPKPLAYALERNGSNIGSALVAAGGVAGMTTVILVNIYAQSRIFYVMARDGLLPKFLGKLHPKYNTPYISIIIIGTIIALISGFVPIDILGNLASIGTLAVFMIASVLVVILRHKQPDAERPFKCPSVYLISTLAILSCGYLFFQLVPLVGHYFAYWMIAGILVYFLYGYHASKMNGTNIVAEKNLN